MSLYVAALFLMVVLIGAVAFYRSRIKKDQFRKYIDHLQEKEVVHQVRLYQYDAEGEAAIASDVCFVKGGFIVFSLAMSHYFFKKGLENDQLSKMASLCAVIEDLKFQDEKTLVFRAELTNVKDVTAGREYKLKFHTGNISGLLTRYSVW